MKNFFVKNSKMLLLVCDIFILPVMFFCRWLSSVMLTGIKSECIWTLIGGKCITCGGTHFVNSLLNGKIIEAFFYNQYLFILLVFLIISYFLLHTYLFFKIDFAKKILKRFFSIHSLIFWCVFLLVFLVIRNIPVISFLQNMI